MNNSAAAILVDPQPRGHIVYPYTDETQIAEAVALFATSGLTKGEAIILVMSSGHRESIRKSLEAEGFDLAELETSGRLVCEDAKQFLGRFLVNGELDAPAFKASVGALIDQAKVASSPVGGVRVFGEMVDLMWKDDLLNTHRLEELWNQVIKTHAVPLLCAYSLAGVKPGGFPAALLSCHSHNISASA